MPTLEPESIANAALQLYSTLPITAKPSIRPNGKHEWTVLAVILATIDGMHKPVPLSLGTGVKCLSHDKLSTHGDCINDCHAEVLARRSFIRWLLTEMLRIMHDDTYHSLFLQYMQLDARFELCQGVHLHLYISQAPCGDGSISELAASQSQADAEFMNAFLSQKSLLFELNGLERGRRDYSRKGILRTKPGRADSVPARSMSCSDKIALWNIVGIQGAAVLHFLTKPIYLETILIGDMFNQDDLQRALIDRIKGIVELPFPFRISVPRITHSASKFESSRSSLADLPTSEIISAFISTCWFRDSTVEVLINGRLRGHSHKSKRRPNICKAEILLLCHALAKLLPQSGIPSDPTYRQLKDRSTPYQVAKSKLLDGAFRGWLRTGHDLEEFRTEA